MKGPLLEKDIKTEEELSDESLATLEPSRLIIASAPFVHEGASTARIMKEVICIALVVVAASWWYFGFSALLLVAASSAGALLPEYLSDRSVRKKSPGGLSAKPSSIKDGSALLTGILLGLTLPPALPLWMAFMGGAAGIVLGKLFWGGLGGNVFNPALVGRAFLQAAFPTAMTTWSAPAGPASGSSVFTLPGGTFAFPLMQAQVDGISAATPLGLFKRDGSITDLWMLFSGNTEGSLGETSAVILILCGVWIVSRRLCDWRLPASTLATVYSVGLVLHVIAPGTYPPPLFMLMSGGLLFAAVFMVTDPVTTPTTKKGAWVFGIGVGLLVVLIRSHGGLPEGVMYAILLMNAFVPHLERWTQPKPFGSGGA